jgi:hypothetical protein
MKFSRHMQFKAIKSLPYNLKRWGLVSGLKFWTKGITHAFQRCGDCGKGLYRLTDNNSAGANGAIEIDVGGHKKTIHLCWLCYHKNK